MEQEESVVFSNNSGHVTNIESKTFLGDNQNIARLEMLKTDSTCKF